ncbi:hypothetical protein ACJ73_03166 [Blastomyces percursus]|uniref:Retrotransposon gag domain-containing protein n=1 Tax=Blastomyces percursus TaxID=1658174 RepID=A0A1J9Q9I4_9EURO|nr:hypothetical protein ACJ73_03166 [Blastomyces percursus]
MELYKKDRLREENKVLEARLAIAEQERDIAQEARDDYQKSTEGQKSEKIPDPPILTDGKEPKFDDWYSKMKNRLRANQDRYPTEELRMAYIELRVGGEAADHLRPYLDEQAEEHISTAQELFNVLKEIYEDPNKKEKARDDLQRLYLQRDSDFHEFQTKFLRLAREAKIPHDQYEFELN